MKINLHQPFRDIYGKELKEKENGNPQMIDETICSILFSGSFIRPSNNPDDDARQKLEAFNLCMKISGAKGEVELTSEECVMVKRAASQLNPGGYGQVYYIVEGK